MQLHSIIMGKIQTWHLVLVLVTLFLCVTGILNGPLLHRFV